MGEEEAKLRVQNAKANQDINNALLLLQSDSDSTRETSTIQFETQFNETH